MPRSSQSPPPPPPGCVWIKEASRLTGLSVKTLYNYRHQDKGPKSFAIGRKLTYAIDGINAWLDEQKNPAPNVDEVRDSRPPEPRKLRTSRHQELTPAA